MLAGRSLYKFATESLLNVPFNSEISKCAALVDRKVRLGSCLEGLLLWSK